MSSSAAFPDLSTFSAPEFLTPMMQQYLRLKSQHADCVLLFRLGDFYEMFLDDAKLGAEILGIVLTSRTRGKDGRVPMAGIPYHALNNYLPKLLAAGLKVAICDQLTEPNGRELVERQVIRIITPGTVLDDSTLQRQQTNFLVAISYAGMSLGVAATDISTGQIIVDAIELTSFDDLPSTLERIQTQLSPREWIIAESLHQQTHFLQALQGAGAAVIHPFAGWPNSGRVAQSLLISQWPKRVDWSNNLKHNQCQIAVAALLNYLEYTQKMPVRHLWLPRDWNQVPHLQIDSASSKNLELFVNLHDGNSRHTLLGIIDHTQSAMGARLLRQWLAQPLQDISAIETRHESVEWLLARTVTREQLYTHLAEIGDIERILARLSVKLGNPRDLRSLAASIAHLRQITLLLESQEKLPSLLGHALPALKNDLLLNWAKDVDRTLKEELPIDPRKGGILQDGQVPELDVLRQEISEHRTWLATFEQQARQETGIGSLKIKFNQVFGFYIEVSNANLHLVPKTFERKQTLVNAERFTTAELKHHEQAILAAEEQTQQLELAYFHSCVQQTVEMAEVFQAAAAAAAALDCVASLAETAALHQYVKPEMSLGDELKLTASRHPVVETTLTNSQFVPNDVLLNSQNTQLLMITGPNMAGKSVLMRQVALITILAHIGSFVPAKRAIIPITDQIFVRSGAADMITAGRSTFMVEMVETAQILRTATPRSLIIMDEIGRGTSTHDGISIAWAVAEHLIQLSKNATGGPKTLFATHYHELTALANQFPEKVANVHLAIADHQGKPVFLYQLQSGAASHSFGIAVAELAGLPDSVVERAQQLLSEFHTAAFMPTEKKTPAKNLPDKKIIEQLAKVDLNLTTPLAALNILDTLQQQLKKRSKTEK